MSVENKVAQSIASQESMDKNTMAAIRNGVVEILDKASDSRIRDDNSTAYESIANTKKSTADLLKDREKYPIYTIDENSNKSLSGYGYPTELEIRIAKIVYQYKHSKNKTISKEEAIAVLLENEGSTPPSKTKDKTKKKAIKKETVKKKEVKTEVASIKDTQEIDETEETEMTTDGSVEPREKKIVQITGAMGSIKFPAIEFVFEQPILVIVQEEDSEYFYEPPKDGKTLTIKCGGMTLNVTYSGIKYTMPSEETHLLFIIKNNQ